MGFVSNSSSSSFVLFGVIATEDIFNNVKQLFPKDLIEKTRKEEWLDDDEELSWKQILYQWSNLYRDCPFDVITDDDIIYIGIGHVSNECDCLEGEFDYSSMLKTIELLGINSSECKIYYGSVRI